MREDIPKGNEDSGKVWDGIAMGARRNAKECEGTRRNAKESDGI